MYKLVYVLYTKIVQINILYDNECTKHVHEIHIYIYIYIYIYIFLNIYIPTYIYSYIYIFLYLDRVTNLRAKKMADRFCNVIRKYDLI